jgi:hypothetical protein
MSVLVTDILVQAQLLGDIATQLSDRADTMLLIAQDCADDGATEPEKVWLKKHYDLMRDAGAVYDMEVALYHAMERATQLLL